MTAGFRQFRRNERLSFLPINELTRPRAFVGWHMKEQFAALSALRPSAVKILVSRSVLRGYLTRWHHSPTCRRQ